MNIILGFLSSQLGLFLSAYGPLKGYTSCTRICTHTHTQRMLQRFYTHRNKWITPTQRPGLRMFPPDKCVCTLRSHLTESMLASQVSPPLTRFLKFTLSFFLSLGDSRRSSCSGAEIRRGVLQEVPQPKYHCVGHQLCQGNAVRRRTCARQAGQVLIDGPSSRRATCRRWTFCSPTTEQNSCSTGSLSSATFQKPRLRTSTPSCCPKPGESGSVALSSA